VYREDFPHLVKAVLATQWPPVVRVKHCQTVGTGEAYAGAMCTGTFLASSFPVGPGATAGEDYPGPSAFNSLTGEYLAITIHMRLAPAGSEAAAGARD
jgi:hypothetical protein